VRKDLYMCGSSSKKFDAFSIWRNHHNKTDDDLGPTTVRRNSFGVSVKILFHKKR